MTEHVFDELPRLLSGDADRAAVAAVAAHLRECADCNDELISAVAAHAALMSSARYAPELANDAEQRQTLAPAAAEPLPDMSLVFAEIRRELAEAEHSPAPSPEPTPLLSRTRPKARRRRTVQYGLVAAAVSVGLVGGGVYVADRATSHNPSARAVALDAYGIGTSAAGAKLIGGDEMVIDASSLPALASGQYYEVWLTNGARTAMAPVGQLDADGMGTFTVQNAEMTGYAAIEVSVQATHGVGSYSGVSVLRGSYA
jgi:hypothetical protein